MHRQSLGSPASKLPVKEEENAKSSVGDEDNDKSLKLLKLSQKPERFLHVIPFLTLLCFLVLYLSSHDPSLTELDEFSGFKWPSHTKDMNEIDGLKVDRLLEVERSEISGIRSLKNHPERKTRASEYRPHRKIAGY